MLSDSETNFLVFAELEFI